MKTVLEEAEINCLSPRKSKRHTSSVYAKPHNENQNDNVETPCKQLFSNDGDGKSCKKRKKSILKRLTPMKKRKQSKHSPEKKVGFKYEKENVRP